MSARRVEIEFAFDGGSVAMIDIANDLIVGVILAISIFYGLNQWKYLKLETMNKVVVKTAIKRTFVLDYFHYKVLLLNLILE